MDVTKTNLATYIASLTASETPYPIEITETEASDWVGSPNNASSIVQIIKDNVISGVYVNLGETVIPSSVTNLYYTFYGCTALTTVPTIPSSVTNLSHTFRGCTALTTAPAIPSSVTALTQTFYGCASLTTAPTIPSSVINLYETFSKCTSLTTAPTIPSSVTILQYTFFECTSLTTAPTIPSSVTRLIYTFYGCTALTTISLFEVDVTTCTMTDAFKNCPSLTAIYVADATEADWHLLYTDTDATGTDYEIYDTDGTLLSSGTVTGTSQVLELSGKSDELVISDNLTPTLAIESATTQLQWHHTGLPYDDELFILNAKNPDTVISNCFAKNTYCPTSASTSDKVVISSGFVLATGVKALVQFDNANTYSGAMTLNVNGTGAKSLYINGIASSSTNKTLPAGQYLCEYDGTNWNVWTTTLPTTIRASSSFTLSDYPDGQKIRIANTHSTNTITCTLPSGQTMNGAGTISIPAGRIIDIELIGTTWKDNLTGNLVGNADTATKLATPRKIGSVDFDGTANINLGQILAIPNIKIQKKPGNHAGNWTFYNPYSSWVFVFWTTDPYHGSIANGMYSCWNPYGPVHSKGTTLSVCTAPVQPPSEWTAFAIGV